MSRGGGSRGEGTLHDTGLQNTYQHGYEWSNNSSYPSTHRGQAKTNCPEYCGEHLGCQQIDDVERCRHCKLPETSEREESRVVV